MSASVPSEPSESPGTLKRVLGLPQAVALNVANMIGVGPFITIPLLMATMNGPQVLVAWIVAAVLVLCDAMVWSELGAALPGSGGSWHFLRRAFEKERWGRLPPFLFIWQFLISGTLEMASGWIGIGLFLTYVMPDTTAWFQAHEFFKSSTPDSTARGWVIVIAGLCLITAVLLCRRIRVLGWVSVALCTVSIVTTLIVIACGASNWNPAHLVFPADAWHVNGAWVLALGAAMRIAVYDYLGYYNICHLGDEVREPAKTIPKAMIISVLLVAAIYLTMNLSIIGVVPYEVARTSQNIVAAFMETLYGRGAAVVLTWLVIITAVACLFVMMLGYSRIPYAAARQGEFFSIFKRVHPDGSPRVSILVLGALTAAFCFLPLGAVIDAAVTLRLLVVFCGQIVALWWVRTRRPDIALPFRMWLYPVPAILALIGWLFLFSTAGTKLILYAGGLLLTGFVVWLIWESGWRNRQPHG